MPPYPWPVDPAATSNLLGADASSYLFWATWAVEGLHYIDDASQDSERKRWSQAGHNPFTAVDLSNARSAAATAVTALDLCAAALGVRHQVQVKSNVPGAVHSIRSLKDAKSGLSCNGCRQWMSSVHDEDYQTLLDARHPLVHRIAKQNAYVTLGSPDLGYISLNLGSPPKEVTTRQIIDHARDTATRHVVALLHAIQAGDI